MLKKTLLLSLFFLFAINMNALEIDGKRKYYDLLPHAKIYIDNSKSLTIENILKRTNEFQDNNKELLAYGYSPNFNVWIQFTLHNTTNKPLDKILEYDNPGALEISCQSDNIILRIDNGTTNRV